jgi:hypothetical protein
MIAHQAHLLGRAHYAEVQRGWSEFSALIEQVAMPEERLLAILRS